MPARVLRHVALIALASPFLAACTEMPGASAASRFAADSVLWRRMLEAEDARGRAAEGVAPLLEGLRANDPAFRAWAVRALGRLESDSLLAPIINALQDGDAEVRAEAANAAVQAVSRGAPDSARAALLARAQVETDPAVLSVVAESLGRLRPGDSATVAGTVQVLLDVVARPSAGAATVPSTQILGAARGFHFLARQPAGRAGISAEAHARLAQLATERGVAESSADSAVTLQRRIRSVAAAALAASGAITEEQLGAILADPDPWVRREAASGAVALRDSAAVRRVAGRALADESAVVRFDALRVLASFAPADEVCPRVRAAVDDVNAHVALQAIDLLGARCPSHPGSALLLDSIAGTLPPSRAPSDSTQAPAVWHRAAHAVVALVSADPRRARERLPAFAAHGDFFVRTYAARVAGRFPVDATLRALAADPHPNVRTAAVEGLMTSAGHAADSIYIAQLREDDGQLLMAAADALEGSTHPRTRAALLDALDRITAQRRETSRDPRRRILDRIAQLGRAADSAALARYTADFDPVIANRAAEILEGWTGTRPEVRPVAPPATPLPTLEELNALAGTRAIIETDGGTVVLRLLPFVAPTNVARFVRLARERYFDGLTLHRIAPNFVVQGGSPNANEYAGDGPFTRDELGLAGNWRGTVGLSTRGRDTGDGQLYFNLIDNVRLDHDYTVWGEVVSGMDVVDAMLEGALIRRIELVTED